MNTFNKIVIGFLIPITMFVAYTCSESSKKERDEPPDKEMYDVRHQEDHMAVRDHDTNTDDYGMEDGHGMDSSTTDDVPVQ